MVGSHCDSEVGRQPLVPATTKQEYPMRVQGTTPLLAVQAA
jgi:hypothetical protein